MAYIGKVPTAVPLTSADIQDGTIALADLSATGTKDATTFLRGDNTFASAGGNMTPAFYARLSSDQLISNVTNTLVQFDTEIFDTNSAYDNSTNYRFTVPSGEAGRYFLFTTALVRMSVTGKFIIIKFFKNGAEFGKFANQTGVNTDSDLSGSIQIVDDASVGDYYDVRIYHNDGGTRTITGHATRHISVFGAYKIIE